ncbi:palmitoyltransferase for Vac8p [Rhinocladiella similis]
MPSYSSPSPSPPPTGRRRRLRSCADKCERGCWTVATFFPLAFVYSLSTWAVWVVSSIGFGSHRSKYVWWAIQFISFLGILLYSLANLSYTIAVFTDPGSPLSPPQGSSKRKGAYSVLPTAERAADLEGVQTITVSSTGAPRYCKKCHVPKPDRTHHCSTCKRCVLKMDHHCPWLSTCLGLHNYKAFVLFLIYISLFSWACFANSAWWMWKELFEESGYLEEIAPVNIILLAVVSGIIGLVLTGFTSWHIYLCAKGQTTIEKLEKTRYLSGVRSRVERNRQEHQLNSHRRGSEGVAERLQRAGEQILEFHANAIPGASRYEEGEEHTSPVPSIYNQNSDPNSNNYHPRHPYSNSQSREDPDQHQENSKDTPALRALRRTYSNIEAERERERYDEYMDDFEAEGMPNAFDLGWRRNLTHLFGPNPLLWWLPVCNTTGDGWQWEVSEKWQLAQEEAARRKERRIEEMISNERRAVGAGVGMRGGGGGGFAGYERDRERDNNGHGYHDGHRYGGSMQSAMSMKPLPHQSQHRGRQRTDFDRGESGQVERFQVSTDGESEDDSDSDSDSYSDVGFNNDDGYGNDAERGRRTHNRPGRSRKRYGYGR